MLYKVTPMLPEPEAKPRKAREPGQPRKKRKSAIYDHEGNEVLITLMCLKCRTVKPLAQFGLRKMADGAIRNQPWCRGCRSGAGTPKARVTEVAEAVQAPAPVTLTADSVSATVDAPVAIVATPEAAAAPSGEVDTAAESIPLVADAPLADVAEEAAGPDVSEAAFSDEAPAAS